MSYFIQDFLQKAITVLRNTSQPSLSPLQRPAVILSSYYTVFNYLWAPYHEGRWSSHPAQIFLTRPSVSSCVRHGCNPLERFPGKCGDIWVSRGSVIRGFVFLNESQKTKGFDSKLSKMCNSYTAHCWIGQKTISYYCPFLCTLLCNYDLPYFTHTYTFCTDARALKADKLN